MPFTVKLLLVVVSVVLLALATFGVPSSRYSLFAGGMLAYVLSTVVTV